MLLGKDCPDRQLQPAEPSAPFQLTDSSDSGSACGTPVATSVRHGLAEGLAMTRHERFGGWKNQLFYGDNLEVLEKKIPSECVDLCYIDPPFNSQRTYNQIYNNVGVEDLAQAQAFIDTWVWDERAMEGYNRIVYGNDPKFQSKLIELIAGLHSVLGQGSLLAYLVSMALRITEIHRVLKPTGSFYLHCDPTAGHYLKIVIDAIFCPAGGTFQNEIIWRRTGSHNSRRSFGPIHDLIYVYNKSSEYKFNVVRRPYMKGHVLSRYSQQEDGRMKFTSGGNVLTGAGIRHGDSGNKWRGFNPTAKNRHWAIPGFYAALMSENYPTIKPTEKLEALYQAGFIEINPDNEWPIMVRYLNERDGVPLQDVWAYQPYTEGTVWDTNKGIDADVAWQGPTDPERLGYPTQKPEGLLERIVKAATNEGDVVLDAYCGCGTTVAVAEKLKRKWIGIDITYQSISLVFRRLEDSFGVQALERIVTDGIPRDMASATALAHKEDDRLRKEFEKWAVLTYTNNRAIINERKGADAGIDGRAYFKVGKKDNAKIIFQVKSGKVERGDVAKLRGDMDREKAAMAVLITLEKPSGPMLSEAKGAGKFKHEEMGRDYDAISIVPVDDIVEHGKHLEIPMSLEVLKAAQRAESNQQMDWILGE